MKHRLKYADDPPADGRSANNVAAIRARVADGPQVDEERIVQYLRRGVGFAATCYFEDVIAGRGVEAVVFMTDGEWVWTNALLYYVERYHWRVEPEFVAHMQSMGWRVPAERDIDLRAVMALDAERGAEEG